VAADQNGRLVASGDMAGQMRAAYSNIRRTLAAHGAGFDEVVKETIYTTDMDALLKASDLRFEYYDKERLPTTSWYKCSVWWIRDSSSRSRSSPSCRRSTIEDRGIA